LVSKANPLATSQSVILLTASFFHGQISFPVIIRSEEEGM